MTRGQAIQVAIDLIRTELAMDNESRHFPGAGEEKMMTEALEALEEIVDTELAVSE